MMPFRLGTPSTPVIDNRTSTDLDQLYTTVESQITLLMLVTIQAHRHLTCTRSHSGLDEQIVAKRHFDVAAEALIKAYRSTADLRTALRFRESA